MRSGLHRGSARTKSQCSILKRTAGDVAVPPQRSGIFGSVPVIRIGISSDEISIPMDSAENWFANYRKLAKFVTVISRL